MKNVRFFNLAVILLLLASVLGVHPAAAKTNSADDKPTGAFIPGEVVVGFADGRTANAYKAQASALADTVGAEVVDQYANMALLSFSEDADVGALAAQLNSASGVKYAEPNYVYSIPETDLTPSRPAPLTDVTRRTGDSSFTVPVSVLQSLRTVKGNSKVATYPNDPYLWTNWGWSYIGGDILSGNATASKNVCVLDTGVDYTHPDLVGKIIKGYDFVNNDADPMDDFGHGTHVAGIIAAVNNNSVGIAGLSPNTHVVAVKVLNAQGWGSSFHVAVGIYYCANRADVSVMNMSLGGGYSLSVDEAVDYAVNTKGKLIVAAAGNENTSTRSYPGGLSTYYPDKVLAVAAIDNGDTTEMGCRASYSNYGSWISVVAPGTDILSTLPWNTPFYLAYYYGYNAGYDFLSGTSMATPFVAAAAARRWGYLPASTNSQVGNAVRTVSPWTVDTTDGCWPPSMEGIHEVNVAALLGRGAAKGFTYNATTGLPLTGATFAVYKGSTSLAAPGVLAGSGIVSSIYSAYGEAINLPTGSNYTGWTNLAGQTTGPQWTFWHTGSQVIVGGYWSDFGRASVPTKDGNFTAVAGWFNEYYDLDQNIWLPNTPNPLDAGQPAPFIVGFEGNSYGYLEGDPSGTLGAFPYALYNREGGWSDWLPIESTTISRRLAHGSLAANAALPYYPGTYSIGITDYGLSEGAHTVLYYAGPFSYVWKDGKIMGAGFVDGCDAHSWYSWNLTSNKTGAATLSWNDNCSNVPPYPLPSLLRQSTGTTGNGTYVIRP